MSDKNGVNKKPGAAAFSAVISIIVIIGIVIGGGLALMLDASKKGTDESDRIWEVEKQQVEKQEVEPISAVDPTKPMVVLTFDDGPSGKYGGRILDALEKNGAHATFFVLGELIEGNEANLKRAVEIGCEIGNHSYDHPILTKKDKTEIKSQISRTNDLITNATGKPAALVRAPGGSVNKDVMETVGAPIISWSLDTIDWKSRNCDAVVKVVLDNVQDGDIILMHEIYKTSAEAAEIIIPELIKRGYQLVTVTEMMEARGISLEPGKVYFDGYPNKTETAEEPKKKEE